MIRNTIAVMSLLVVANTAQSASITVEALAALDFTAQGFDPVTGDPVNVDFLAGGVRSISANFREDVFLTESAFLSLGNSDFVILDNTSSAEIFIRYDVFSEVSASVFIEADLVNPRTSFEVTSFAGSIIGSSDLGQAFASVRGDYECTAANLAIADPSCSGFDDFEESVGFFSGGFSLVPGESVELRVETAPLIIATIDQPLTPVPLPASVTGLLTGLAGLAFVARRRRNIQ